MVGGEGKLGSRWVEEQEGKVMGVLVRVRRRMRMMEEDREEEEGRKMFMGVVFGVREFGDFFFEFAVVPVVFLCYLIASCVPSRVVLSSSFFPSF